MDKKATKGEALKIVAEINNISLENTVAIGDNLNDQSMLEIVKYSIAMKNGNKLLKDNAKYITDKTNTEGGVADSVMKLLK